MSIVREGTAALALTSVAAATLIATAVWRRSWPLWLLGYVMLLVAAWFALTSRATAASRTAAVTPLAHITVSRVSSRQPDVAPTSVSTPVPR